MSRSSFALCLLLVVVSRPAWADDLPIIVTYELKKQRQDARILERNPRAFWIRQIVARIEDKLPTMPKPFAEAVTVQIGFVVGHDGRLVSKSIVQSSGNPDADRIALTMLDSAQPFPPMPAAMTDASLPFSMPVRFR